MNGTYQKVAYIGLRDSDGSYLASVPLYIKVDDVGKTGLTKTQEELIHRISEIMLKHYKRQIDEYITKIKKGEKNNVQIQG